MSRSVRTPSGEKGIVFIILNTTWNLVNFRSGLIRALMADGYQVVAVAPPDAHIPRLLALGCQYQALPMDSGGTNPIKDLLLTWRFYWLLRKFRPVAFLPFTVKPNVFGSLAAGLLNIPVINNIAGLGTVFIKQSLVTRIVKTLYRIALRKSNLVFFQNRDDLSLFIHEALVRPEITGLLPGSGIDIQRFQPQPLPRRAGFRFLMVARMLKDKGVLEFVAAARLLRAQHPEVEFALLGFLDVDNPTAISRQQMNQWVSEGVIQYLGEAEDVRPYIADADCVVLPSYREGTPRTLLEAAAIARPMITTDAVGCREVVDDGETGYLCAVADAADLAAKMQRMLQLPWEARNSMGLNARQKIEREFDENIVIGHYLAALANLRR